MSKEIYISSTPHETRLAIVENDALTEIYYERENEYTLAGSIYNGKVTRVLPGMQSSFVDIGLDRDAFLYITDFMEEAGDSADFEASANGSGEPKRAPRDGGRGGRQDRGDRSDRPALPRPEPTDEDLFTQAVSGLDPARPVADAERGERSRRGGRNRRDRNPERRAPEPQPEPIVASPPAIETSEVGEGAPGADGSRRWRGRRGRRGNRGPGAGQPQTNDQTNDQIDQAAPVADEPARKATGPVYDAYESYPEVPELEAAIPMAQFERVPRGEHNDRNDRGGRGRRDRGGAPLQRNFEASQDLFQVDASAAVEETPAIEPLILPGESLSKYRTPDPAQAASSPVESAPVAAVSDFVAQGWDGGAVLPGETIRPRTASAASSYDAPRRDDRGPRRDGGRDRGRNERGGRDSGGRDRDERKPRQEFAAPAPVYAAPAAVYTEQPAAEAIAERLEPSHVEPEQQHAAPVEAQIDSTFVAPPPMPSLAVADPISEPEESHEHFSEQFQEQEQFHETVHEFEPEEASASYRIDPVPPSEFRQAAPVLEEECVEEPATIVEPAREEQASFQHDVTSIFPSGEMHSEPETLLTQDLVAPSEFAQGAEHSTVPVAADAVAADQTVPQAAPWFEPGSGVLEEEMLEDEEDEAVLPVVQARHDDPHEQEALEHAADLGTMLREMSIDNLTRSEAAVEEEDDDFDEDFLEEDQDFAVEVSDTDEFEEEDPTEPEYQMEEGEGDVEPEFSAPASDSAPAAEAREPRRNEPARREGRRDGRRGDRNRRSGSGDRDRGNSASDKPSGDRHRHEGGRGRQTMQATNLPAISDLLKPGQELLCQIAKEPIAKKGARITSHIALPGRFLVFMPTVSHTGVSRKIESDGERRRLKEILLSEKGDAAGGFIVRTAASGASEDELRSDLRFLLNLWTDIKTRSETSKSPALIYHDLNLVERVLRDQVTDNFSAIWVDTESQYEQVLRFLQRFQPSLIRRVKLYTKETPLFEQFGITEEINKALRSKVWLKSGGSIVINQTEALVAIDINTGKFVGKTTRLEDTIVKTNLDAIPEIVRQIRLRDLGGIIIIDFIDMDERKNRNKVMAALEEELKSDRAPSKVLPFNDFGLVAITRKRVKQSLERTLSSTCNVCQGTGMTKSPVTVCNDIYIEMRKMQKHLDRGDVMLRVHPEVVKQLKSSTSRWLQEMEEMVGKTILVKSDPSLHPEQFDLH